jgi:purine-nucleoside phosphorylase
MDTLNEEGIVTPELYFQYFKKGLKIKLPEKAILTFWWPKELVSEIEKRKKREFSYANKVKIIEIEMEEFLIPCLIMAGRAPIAAEVLEEINYFGVKEVILIGGAGILIEIPAETLIIPNEAIRDEGTSYHYLSPFAKAVPSLRLKEKLKKSCKKYNVSFIEGKVWSTDGFYRETPSRIKKFRNEGAVCVEMETAACFAVAQYRKMELAALFYPTDLLAEKWKILNLQRDYQKILQIAIDTLK